MHEHHEELVYKSQDGEIEFVIPRNISISISPMVQIWNTDLVPNPDKLMSKKCLINDQPNCQLQKKIVDLGNGGRLCIGERQVHSMNMI